MNRILASIISRFFDDQWVSMEEHNAALKHRDDAFMEERRGIRSLQAAVERLTRERNAILVEGLHRFGMLPKASDRRGTLSHEFKVERLTRAPFGTSIQLNFSDDELRPIAGPLKPVIIDQLVMLFSDLLKRELNQKLCPTGDQA